MIMPLTETEDLTGDKLSSSVPTPVERGSQMFASTFTHRKARKNPTSARCDLNCLQGRAHVCVWSVVQESAGVMRQCVSCSGGGGRGHLSSF